MEILKEYITANSKEEDYLFRNEEVIKKEAFIYENYPEVDLSWSYSYLIDSFIKQYDFIKKNTNIKIEAWQSEGQPYSCSREMSEDLDKGHFFFFKTEKTKDEKGSNSVNGPMLDKYDGLYLNDIFRIVHDIMGHYAFRNNFSQQGEINAWLIHRSMMDKKGWAALWTETRGQNASFYYDKYKDIEIKKRPFPVQRQVKAPDKFLWVSF